MRGLLISQGALSRPPAAGHAGLHAIFPQGCMKKVQAWLQENLAILLGVCVGVAVIEVCPSPNLPLGFASHTLTPLLALISCGVSGARTSRGAVTSAHLVE